ncbi:MAG: hypothetical protein WA821_01545 [Anaerolineales bacterium]
MTQIETAKDLKNLRKSAKSVDEFLVHVAKTFLEHYTQPQEHWMMCESWWLGAVIVIIHPA